jgi:polar amino acid transport system substrate-binding protein
VRRGIPPSDVAPRAGGRADPPVAPGVPGSLRGRHLAAILTAAALGLCAALPRAEGAEPDRVLVAVLADSAPFSFQVDDGTWRGLAVELWSRIARELAIESRLEGMDRAGLLGAVASGRARFGVGPISITAGRLELVDFSVPFYATGVAVAVPHPRRRGAWVLTDAILSLTFLRVFGGLLVFAVVVGLIFWMVERRANPAFAGKPMHGWGKGIWLSVVTMTTVGYGDYAPRTLAGRVVAATWMFAGIVLISILTGTVATLLTIERLGSRIASFEDLGRARVAVVTASAAAQLLENQQLPALQFPDLDHAVRAVVDGRAEALVHDRALLASALQQYRDPPPVTILPGVARLEYYAFAMQPGEPLRPQVNAVIARILDTAAWRRLNQTYLGPHGEHHWIGASEAK